MRRRLGQTMFTAVAILLILASAAWGCTTIEGSLTITPTSQDLGEDITVTYSGGTNLADDYEYYIVLSSESSGNNCFFHHLAGTPASPQPPGSPMAFELGRAKASGGSFGPVTVTLPSVWWKPQPSTNRICVMSVATYDPDLPPSDHDYCNGNPPLNSTEEGRRLDCTQAEARRLARRGQVTEIVLL